MSCRVDHCCFCIGLKTGCYIIGVLSLVVAIINIAIVSSGNGGTMTREEGYSYQLAQDVLSIFLAILLLFGVFANRKLLILVYLILVALWLAYVAIFSSILLITSDEQTMDLVANVLVMIVFIGLNLYLWVVVYSYYLELSEEQDS